MGYESRSCRLTSVLREPLLAGASALAVIPGDLLRRNRVLDGVAPREPDEHRIGGDESQAHQPPDVPDQREAGDRRKKGRDEPGRAVPRHLDRLIVGFWR